MLSLFRSRRPSRKGPRPAPKSRQLQFESLEDRKLLSVSYLDNGVVRLGVDLGLGGAITYLSYSPANNHDPAQANVINSFDSGREIQQSYYAGPSQYDPEHNQHPGFSPWPWNATQAGDIFGNPSKILASSNDGTTLYVKSQPMQFALNNVPVQAAIEEWITLDGPAVKVHCRLTNVRLDNPGLMAPISQELPAIYTVGTLYQLVSYTGSQPFTSDALTYLPQAGPPSWTDWHGTESWAAMVDSTGWGLGVYEPGVVEFIGGFSGTPGQGGPSSPDTGYMAPVYADVLDPRIVYDYSYNLILGSVSDIRTWVYQHPSDPRPNYNFVSDRQHWYAPAGDAGSPSNGYYEVNLVGNDPQVVGPLTAFRAESVSKLYISAAYHLSDPSAAGNVAQLFWRTDTTPDFSEDQSIRFNIIPDGQYHTYELDLASSPAYHDLIAQLRFDPVIGAGNGDFVDIAYVSYQTQTPSQTATTTAVTASSNTSLIGRPLTFTATVKAPGTGKPTGTVTFKDGSTTLGTVALDANGRAIFNTAALGAGGHTITAVYNGSTYFAPSSGSATQTISQPGTITSVAAGVGAAAIGQPVTLTVTARAAIPGTGTPRGTVIFKDGGTILGTATLDANGRAIFNTAALGVGGHTITAVYNGDTYFTPSSGSTTKTITQAATTTKPPAIKPPAPPKVTVPSPPVTTVTTKKPTTSLLRLWGR
jgi:hypothetical protein